MELYVLPHVDPTAYIKVVDNKVYYVSNSGYFQLQIDVEELRRVLQKYKV